MAPPDALTTQTNMTTANIKETDLKSQFEALVEQMNDALHLLYDFPPSLKSSNQISGFNQLRWTLNANFNEIRNGNLHLVQSYDGARLRLYMNKKQNSK
jgi:uncharacterized membrane protein (UPF0182 family)